MELSDIYKDETNKINDLFDINFSFRINDRGKYVINNECWKIKESYKCQRVLNRKVITTDEFIGLVNDEDQRVDPEDELNEEKYDDEDE